MSASLAIVITSYAGNGSQALDRLLESIRACPDASCFKVIVVVGGHDAYDVRSEENIVWVHAPHNSIDFTGLIALVELEDDERLHSDWYFYVHETCQVGPTFFEKIHNLLSNQIAKNIAVSTVSFPFPSMNIGWYRRDYVLSSRHKLLDMKNLSMSREEAHRFKALNVRCEDMLFKSNSKKCHAFVDPDKVVSEATDVYGTGVPRITELYRSIDMIKYKANWTRRTEFVIDL